MTHSPNYFLVRDLCMHLTYRGIYNMSTCNMTGDTSGAGKFTWDLPHKLSSFQALVAFALINV